MSEIALSGFRNEDWIVSEFNNWTSSTWALNWLSAMGYDKPKKVCAQTTRKMGFFYKADVLTLIDDNVEWVSVKKFTASFNQIDKNWVKKFADLWNMPNEITETLRMYCGEAGHRPIDSTEPITTTTYPHRFLLNELPSDRQAALISFFNKNKRRIVRDVVAGRGKTAARWMLVVEELCGIPKRSALLPVDTVVQHCTGPASITKLGNLKLGRITIQRKGGDSGKSTAQMLQFKFSPKELFEVQGARVFAGAT